MEEIMATADQETTQAAWIAYLKSRTTLVAALDNSLQIKELQFQGDTFLYPAVRVSVDYMPSINGCGPDDIEVDIDIFSEEKSSKEAVHIAAILMGLLQKKTFTQNGLKFPMIWVEKIDKPFRDIFAWKVSMHIKGLVS
jgi:hypothetical protein